ncbi:MAG TPA: RidA family protein [Solirubrobacteraceae bacterium]|jgi:reactive intermediate/imine deaminase
MSKESVNPEGMANPVGPYAHVVSVPAGGRMIFCAGAVALDKDGKVVGEGDIVTQTRQVMENLRLALQAANASFADIVKITNYVIDAEEWKRVLPVRAEYIKEPYPASTFVEVRALMFPELLIEIEAIAITHDA